MRYTSLVVVCCLLLVGIAAQKKPQATAQQPPPAPSVAGENLEAAQTFDVTPGQWLDTGITLRRGQRFHVAATGTIKATEYPYTEIGPNGNGYYSLKGYLSPLNSAAGGAGQFMVLGSQGGGTAQADSTLRLGVTRSNYFAADPKHPEDQLYRGSFEVTVYLEKVADETATTPRPVTKGPVTLLKLVGDANYLAGGEDWREAFEGMRLSDDDEIHTGPDSEATLQFPDGSTVTLKEMTRIKMRGLINTDTRYTIEILLKMGEISSKVKPQEVIGSGFTVKSPTATTSVRGTIFTVHYDENTQTATVVVEQGSVLVTPTSASLRPFMLRAGQEVEVGQASVGAVRPAGNAAEALVWQRVGIGDCGGRDVGSSEGATPVDSQARAGLTAVCWDGGAYRNGGRVFCTYKNVSPEQCRGGGNPGVMYRAVRAPGAQ